MCSLTCRGSMSMARCVAGPSILRTQPVPRVRGRRPRRNSVPTQGIRVLASARRGNNDAGGNRWPWGHSSHLDCGGGPHLRWSLRVARPRAQGLLDGGEVPAVEVPLGDFFCNGFATRARVSSIPIVVAPTGGMNCYFPMPFRTGAKLTLESQHPGDLEHVFFQIDFTSGDEFPPDSGYFHAQWRRSDGDRELGDDHVILDDIEGPGPSSVPTSPLPHCIATGGVKGGQVLH